MTKPIKSTRTIAKIEHDRAEPVIRYLEYIKGLNQKTDTLAHVITKRQDMLFRSGVAEGEVVRRTTEMDPVGDGFMKLAESVDELDTTLIEYTDRDDEAMAVIENLLGTPEYEVLDYRYIRGWTYREIADHMSYSEQRIFQFRESAIKKLYDFIPKEFKQRKW